MDPILNANILLAQTSLVQSLQGSASDFELAANSLQQSFAITSNEISEAEDDTSEGPNSRNEETNSGNSLSDISLIGATSGGASFETSVVNMIQAKNAYLATAQALDIVGDVENKLLDILR